MAMPQDFPDFGQRGAVAQHARRHRMPKLMRPRRGRGNTRPVQPVPDDGTNGTLAEKAPEGGFAPEKHAPTAAAGRCRRRDCRLSAPWAPGQRQRSEEHTSELQSRSDLVCRLLLEKKKDHRTV